MAREPRSALAHLQNTPEKRCVARRPRMAILYFSIGFDGHITADDRTATTPPSAPTQSNAYPARRAVPAPRPFAKPRACVPTGTGGCAIGPENGFRVDGGQQPRQRSANARKTPRVPTPRLCHEPAFRRPSPGYNGRRIGGPPCGKSRRVGARGTCVVTRDRAEQCRRLQPCHRLAPILPPVF